MNFRTPGMQFGTSAAANLRLVIPPSVYHTFKSLSIVGKNQIYLFKGACYVSNFRTFKREKHEHFWKRAKRTVALRWLASQRDDIIRPSRS